MTPVCLTSMTSSKRKGDSGEREFLHLLEAKGIAAHRNDQKWVGGLDNPDISVDIRGTPIHVEVKRREHFSLYPAMEQAVHDANGHALPCVAYRANRKPWVVILRLEDLLGLMTKGEFHEGV